MKNLKQRYLHTQDEVGEYLGLAHSTVNRLVKSGEIKGVLIGSGEKRKHMAFPIAELNEYRLKRINKGTGGKCDAEMLDAYLVVALYRRLQKDARSWVRRQIAKKRTTKAKANA